MVRNNRMPAVPPREEWDFDFYDKEPKAQLDEDFSNVIVVDGLPIVQMEKFDRLNKKILKDFSAFGELKKENVYHPLEEGKETTTCGYCFLEYKNGADAHAAVAQMNDKKFGRQNRLQVNHYSYFEEMAEYPEEYKEPSIDDIEYSGNLKDWLLDDRFRDQFVLRQGDKTEIYWNDPIMTNTLGRAMQYAGERESEVGRTWTDGYVAWSPRGSYLATFHSQGIATWGGRDFHKLQRFAHPDVMAVDFSPMENYLVTFNARENPNKRDPIQCFMIWDVKSGRIARAFPGGYSLTHNVGVWPIFKWSFDDKFFARLDQDSIRIYETPSMKQASKKRLVISGVEEFEWSPTDHIISYIVPEKSNSPATIVLLEIPSMKIVGEKHLTMVSKMTMQWQVKGDYLAVKIEKLSRNRKPKGTSFNIFRVHEKDIPVDTLDMKLKMPPLKILPRGQTQQLQPPPIQIVAFAFDSRNQRFAVIYAEAAGGKNAIKFYKIQKNKVKLENTLTARIANRLYFSPRGGHVVIAGLGQMNGVLEFYDADKKLTANTADHYMCSDIEWDPCGRYVTSYVTQPIRADGNYKSTMENGYKIWSNVGVLLAEVKYESLYLFLWRPRPPSVLPDEKRREILNDLRVKYYPTFEKNDKEDIISRQGHKFRERQRQLDEFKKYLQRCRREYLQEKEQREALRDGRMSDNEEEFAVDDIEVEEQIEIHEETIGSD